ncbi:MAG TPA: ABC transporter permease [Thermoanaerobaculia bacterium]|nr:ABC transporter permease [Thermoanaerobaculia bacterium]
MTFLPLVENEVLKLWKRRRFRLVLLILVALIGIVVVGRVEGQRRFGSHKDWRIETQEQVARMRNWDRQGRLLETQRRWVRFEIARLQYHLDRNINPEEATGPLFARGFANFASYLLLHLLAIVFAADIVSSEFAEGTIKLLLTRPIGRGRVLASKLAALLLAVALTVLLGGVVAYAFGGLAWGYRGWDAPVLSGFRLVGETVDSSGVRAIPLWEDAVLVFGLAWFATATVGAIGFMTSVLLRSTAASMGTMFAALILGTILPRVAPTWEFQKYLFVTNLPLPDYYTGSPPPISGMDVPFSVAVLAVWALAALAVSFFVFARRDVLA